MPCKPLMPLLLTGAILAGCSGAPSLSTSSIFGGGDSKPSGPENTPAARALQVGGTAARATKCGYNFDANKLRTNYLAYEAAQAPGADQSNITTTYDTAYAGVSKAAGPQSGYCSAGKTKDIKSALNRHLAGDYSPDPPKPEPIEEGLFSGWGSSSAPEMKTSLPTDNSRD